MKARILRSSTEVLAKPPVLPGARTSCPHYLKICGLEGRTHMGFARTSTDSGFTLLEVLVAITILAIGIALTVSTISKSLVNIRIIDARMRIVDQANSVMELTLLDPEIKEPGSFNGDFEDGVRWTMRIEEYIPEEMSLSDPAEMPVRLLAYTVEMFQPHSSAVEYRLRTLKLTPKP